MKRKTANKFSKMLQAREGKIKLFYAFTYKRLSSMGSYFFGRTVLQFS